MEQKLKHLELIQGVINRLATNSFQMKGWTVVLVAAILVLLARENRLDATYIAIAPILIFWALDGYFLWQERLYRALYDHVRTSDEDQIDFAMNVAAFRPATVALGLARPVPARCYSSTLRSPRSSGLRQSLRRTYEHKQLRRHRVARRHLGAARTQRGPHGLPEAPSSLGSGTAGRRLAGCDRAVARSPVTVVLAEVPRGASRRDRSLDALSRRRALAARKAADVPCVSSCAPRDCA